MLRNAHDKVYHISLFLTNCNTQSFIFQTEKHNNCLNIMGVLSFKSDVLLFAQGFLVTTRLTDTIFRISVEQITRIHFLDFHSLLQYNICTQSTHNVHNQSSLHNLQQFQTEMSLKYPQT